MKAVCTWGDGSDVTLTLEGTSLMLYEHPSQPPPPQAWSTYGYVYSGSIELTAKEAQELGESLILAAGKAFAWNKDCKNNTYT